MKKKKKRTIAFLVLLCFFYFLSAVEAGQVGVSPASLTFDKVLRGGYAEKYLTLTVNSDETYKVRINFSGEISSWLEVENRSLELNRNNPLRISIKAHPPEDIPNGNYTGFIRIFIERDSKVIDQHAVSSIKTALDVFVVIEIVDFEIKECLAKNFKVSSSEKGEPIIVSLDIFNRGNIKFKPEVEFKIWDLEKRKLIKQDKVYLDFVKPTTESSLSFEIPTSDFEIGQYWIDVFSIDCYSNQVLTFDILEEGALRSSGYIKEIVLDSWVKTGETMKIIVLFENNGEKNVKAKFKGTISLNNKIIEILESEFFSVAINETYPFVFYFTPKKEGVYKLSGSVYYDGKKTFEKSKIINVQSNKSSIFVILKYSFYLLLLIVIIYLIREIKKEKRRLHD
ncbi:MAG: hypothetical protein QW273_03685 [Candidatus Pacearchaeota archaeon]